MPKRANYLVWAGVVAMIAVFAQTRNPGMWGGQGARMLIVGLLVQAVGGALFGAALAAIWNRFNRNRRSGP